MSAQCSYSLKGVLTGRESVCTAPPVRFFYIVFQSRLLAVCEEHEKVGHLADLLDRFEEISYEEWIVRGVLES